ncbi:MAG: LCP family protein [Chloroflexi bacterium]|nr:LCP family protein [Chloroflexota bacterium]
MRNKFIYLAICAALALSACGSNLPPHIAAQFGTPTPTPFLPGFAIESLPDDKSASVLAISYADDSPEKTDGTPWGRFPAPSALSEIAIPAPVEPLTQPEGQINILIMGSDQRPGDGGFRTDVMLLLTLDKINGRVSATSFPRDLYLYIPGWRVDRINVAQARGGFDMTALTFDYNLGVRPDHWVLVNFDGFTQVIDSLGGITVQVGRSLSDQREGFGTYGVSAGSVAMDAETALWYVRSRGTSNDFDRTRRQQEVLQAIFLRFLSLDALTRAPDLYEAYRQTVTTDLSIGDILGLLPLANDIKNGLPVDRYAIGPNEVIPYVTSGGASVLLPDENAVRAVMSQAVEHQSSP